MNAARSLDLFAIVEPDPADDLVGEIADAKRFFQHATLGGRAVHDRKILATQTAQLHQPPDFADDEISLVLLVGQFADGDLLAVVVVGAQPPVDTVAIQFDDVIGHRYDACSRAVIDFQIDALRFFERLLEIEDVADERLAPAIDRLVLIPDDEKVLVLSGQRFHQHVLHPVGVLIFIYQNVLEAILIPLQHARLGIEEVKWQDQQVVEIDRVGLAQESLIFLIGARHQLFAEIRRGIPRFGRTHQAGFIGTDAAAHPSWRKLFGILTDIGDRLFDDRLLVGIVVDREIAQDAQMIGHISGVLAQHPHPERMEGPHGQAGRGIRR